MRRPQYARRSIHRVEERETMEWRPGRVPLRRVPTGDVQGHSIRASRFQDTRRTIRVRPRACERPTDPCMHVHVRRSHSFSCRIIRSITARAHHPLQVLDPGRSLPCRQPADQLISQATSQESKASPPSSGTEVCEPVSGGLSCGHPTTRRLRLRLRRPMLTPELQLAACSRLQVGLFVMRPFLAGPCSRALSSLAGASAVRNGVSNSLDRVEARDVGRFSRMAGRRVLEDGGTEGFRGWRDGGSRA